MKLSHIVDLKKGTWSDDEDQKLTACINKYGTKNWNQIPEAAGLQRSGKSCRLRWTNYLRPDLKKGSFSTEEIETIMKVHELLGNKWSMIAAKLPGRTDNDVKNFWHTHAKKYLKSNPKVIGAQHYGRKKFKHKGKRVMDERKFSICGYVAEEPNFENFSSIIDSTQFPIMESYSPTMDSNNAASSEILSAMQEDYFSGHSFIEDANLSEISSTLFQEATSISLVDQYWNGQEFAYASNNDELTSFWFNIFVSANHLLC